MKKLISLLLLLFLVIMTACTEESIEEKDYTTKNIQVIEKEAKSIEVSEYIGKLYPFKDSDGGFLVEGKIEVDRYPTEIGEGLQYEDQTYVAFAP